jgi:osmotically inducible protein OsmC
VDRIHLKPEAKAPGLDEAGFRKAAELAKENCPISKLLRPGLSDLTLEARLV